MTMKKAHFRVKTMAEKTGTSTASCTINQTSSYKSGMEWR
jgi:hypothetical protein